MTPKELKLVRKQKGLSTRQLGELSGVSASAISRYETGKCGMQYRNMQALEKALFPDNETGKSPAIAEINEIITKLSNLAVSIKGS